MELIDLKPQESSFKLQKYDEIFKLNPITLADEAWLLETYGQEGVSAIFTEMNLPEICRVVFRLMSLDSKRAFKKKEVTLIDEEGNETTGELGGLDLFMAMMSGNDDKVAVINALIENIGASRPEVKEDSKKKEMGQEEK